MIIKSKLVTMCWEVGTCNELGPTGEMFLFKDRGKKEQKDVEVKMPVHPQHSMYYEHFEGSSAQLPYRLSFILMGANPELERFTQYQNVTVVDLSQKFDNIETIFEVVSQLPKCEEVRVFFEQGNIKFGPADDGFPMHDGNSITLFKNFISPSVRRLVIDGNHKDIIVPCPSRFDATLVLAEGYFPNLDFLKITMAGVTGNEYDATNHLLIKKNVLKCHRVELEKGVLRCSRLAKHERLNPIKEKSSSKTDAKTQATPPESSPEKEQSAGQCSTSAAAVHTGENSNRGNEMVVSLKRLNGGSNLSRLACVTFKCNVTDTDKRKQPEPLINLNANKVQEKLDDLPQIKNQAQRDQAQDQGQGQRQEEEKAMVPRRRERPPTPYPRSILISDDEYEITAKMGVQPITPTNEHNKLKKEPSHRSYFGSTYEDWESSSDEDRYLRRLLQQIPKDVVQNVKVTELQKILHTVKNIEDKKKAAAAIKQEVPGALVPCGKRGEPERASKPELVLIEGVHYERRPQKVRRTY